MFERLFGHFDEKKKSNQGAMIAKNFLSRVPRS
jgi:hypothetical protein